MSEQTSLSGYKDKIEWSLFLMRVGVFIVMFIWAIEKFVNPGHLIGNLEYFYLIDGIDNNIIYIGGVIHMIVVFAFLAGMWKRYTYGFMMVAHGLSTIVSWRQYTTDFNIVFYTAWPMLAACVALYILRDLDVKYTLKNPHNQA